MAAAARLTPMASDNSFDARADLELGGRTYEIFRLDALQSKYDVARLPFSLKILLENLLRNEDGVGVRREDIEALATWDAKAEPTAEIAFTPARVVMQDFTGVPAVVDLAAMRDAMAEMGGDPSKINPLVPAELVIDHSVQVDAFGTRQAFQINADREFERNQERYAFLRWGQEAFDGFSVVPPDTGIVHQVNLEYLSRVVFTNEGSGEGGATQAYPDTLVGTDSHTTMINGLGILGWGVGGIEAEAAMLGQPMSMLLPQVIGFKLHGSLPEGATATDLVLTVTQMLRQHGVVGRFVEFYGEGIPNLALADRATLGNMSPEFGSTCAIFPIDAETLRYLRVLRPAQGAHRARGGLRPRAGLSGTTSTPRTRPTPTPSSSTSATSSPRSPGPSARRTASRSRSPRRRSASRSRTWSATAAATAAWPRRAASPACRGRRRPRTPRPTSSPRSPSRPPTRRPPTATPPTTASPRRTRAAARAARRSPSGSRAACR